MPRKQFEDADCSRGAPMGRGSYGDPRTCRPRSVSLFKVNLQGDYDDGGAYWGGGSDVKSLYCARSDDGVYLDFARASSRREAAEAMRIPEEVLIQGSNHR